MIRFSLFISVLFFYSCSTTTPTDVKISDTQTITSIKYGSIKSSIPVKIKGESNWIGATAGGLIGGLLGTAVCGENEIVGTKCQDIAVVFGTLGGAALGSVTQAKLGDHNGFQYIIDLNDNENDTAIVQGDEKPFKKGQKVVIIYGNQIRVMPYEE